MKQIKAYFFQRFNTFSLLFLLSSFSIFLLMIRIKATHSYFLMFMVWNLFLAYIPFAVTAMLKFESLTPGKLQLLLWSCLWLLFLPNAPYMLTDLVHLLNDESILLYDTVLILAFAITGMLLYVLTSRDMYNLLWKHYESVWLNMIFRLMPVMMAIGIYVGRFLRWNSWDIFTSPTDLLGDLLVLFILPGDHSSAWIFIVGFSGTLVASEFILKKIHFLNKLN